jgi:hypothetical protein
MGVRTSMRVAAAGLGAVAVVALMPGGTAYAVSAGQLCNVNQNTWVRYTEGGSVMYTIPAGGGFRVDHLNWQQTWVYGHGNNQPDGWIPNDGRLYNCHY